MKRVYLLIEDSTYISVYSNKLKVYNAIADKIKITSDSLSKALLRNGVYEFSFEMKYNEGMKQYKIVEKKVL